MNRQESVLRFLAPFSTYLVWVESVDDQAHQLSDLGLEGESLGIFSHDSARRKEDDGKMGPENEREKRYWWGMPGFGGVK